jgi:DNA-binding MarR family transcriptional regulator
LYLTGILDVKRYALVMAQRGGPGTEDDSDAEILEIPVLRDEVDELVAAWRAQRPDLDVEPMQVLSRISRLARHLDIARRGAFADHDLETWEFDVLSALRRQGPPFQLTPGALLRATLVTSGTMTNRIDQLAKAGLVRREPDPRDKRGVLVTLTEQGVARADAALADLLRRERDLLAGLDDGERQHLADLMRILLAPFDADLFEPGLFELCLFELGGDAQPAVLQVRFLGLDAAQFRAERGELLVVGGVCGQQVGELGLADREPVQLAFEPLEFLARGPLLGRR